MSTTIAQRSRFIVGTALTLAVLLSGMAQAGPSAVETIENRLQQYQARFNQGDAEAVAQLFSEDVVYYDPTGRVHEGRAAVQQYYRGNMAAGFSDMAIEKIEIEVRDDTAYDVARYTISDPKGNRLAGYHLAILEKEEGEWMVQRTLVNAEMPGPPPE
ncbi:nuclear transport factor 2 family protein [Ectothiorhodospiraceae bacterium WFHF3C12]|nr:nuclear transport factor 2 family protein [Ectothiorhodospiraceae bacterium WFHF3C12]